MPRRILAVLLLTIAPAEPGAAQVFHLPPTAPGQQLDGEPILELTIMDGCREVGGPSWMPLGLEASSGSPASRPADRSEVDPMTLPCSSHVRATRDALVIQTDSGTVTIPFGNRSAVELAEDLRRRYTNLRVRAPVPEVEASRLAAGTATRDGGRFMLAGEDRSSWVTLGFGAVLGSGRGGEGILENAGVHLNATGSHRSTRFRPMDWRVRIGLAVDERVAQLESDLPSVEGFIDQADQVFFSISNDIHVTTGPFRLLISLESAVAWNQFDGGEIDLPPSLASLPPDAQEVARSEIDAFFSRAEPALQLGTTIVLADYDSEGYRFYGGGGVVWTDVIERQVRVPPSAPEDRRVDEHCSTLICGEIDGDLKPMWRAMAGIDVGGVVDLRMDAVGGIGTRLTEPVLRFLVIKPFTVTAGGG